MSAGYLRLTIERLPRRPRTVVVAWLVLSCACTSQSALDLSGMDFSEQPLVGKVIWNDLITEDLDSARRFYQELFGWTFETAQGPGDGDYIVAKSGDVYVAGLVTIASPPDGTVLSRWLPYVSVEDVDAAVERARAAGGDVAAGPLDVSAGRVAAILDPEGAVLGLARSRLGDPDDRTTAPAAGRVVWTELLAARPDSAAGFYDAVVGYDARTIERRGGRYTLLTMNGVDRAGILENPSEEVPPRWLTYFGVGDVAAAAARAETLGGTIVLPVSPDLRAGTMAVVADPSGAILVLQQIAG